MSKYCRNKILNREIHRYQISVDYWTSMRTRSESMMDKELATMQVWINRNMIRRIEKLKSK